MRGFPLVACVATDESVERVDTLKSYGARLVVGGDLSPSAEAARLCEQNPTLFFNLDTFEADSDDAAYLTLGPEIWDQTNGSLTHWICHPGTGLSGVSRFLKERSSALKIVSAIPSEPVFQRLTEIRTDRDPSKVEEDVCKIDDQDALETCIRLCREEGIMAGAISGLNVCAALQMAAQVDTPSLIVTVLPDIGIKFLSTVYNPDWVRQNNLVSPPLPPIPGCVDLQCQQCSNGGDCEQAQAIKDGVGQAPKMRRQRSAPVSAAGGVGATRYYKRYEDLIGSTPIIDLSHLIDQSQCHITDGVKVLAKCEFFNPGFSLKDRIARNILDRAEAAGMLKPGMCVVAASSGNTGAATAMLCAMRGYSCIITTCPKCSKEKQDAIKAYGAHLFVTSAGLSEDSPDHYMNVARRLTARNPALFYDVDQYDTLANPEGHYLTLGPEIWEQSQCEVTHFICAGSTGGTISGVGRFLKERNPKIKVVLADPIGSVFTNYFLSGNVGKPGKYLVEGVGKGSIPGAMDFSLVDAVLPVTDADAFQTCSRLCREEGIWPGGSSGLNVFAALRLAETVEEPCTIVTVMPDLGVKYLTKIYNDEWLRSNKLMAHPPVHVDGLAPACF
jgi:cysteine synthase